MIKILSRFFGSPNHSISQFCENNEEISLNQHNAKQYLKGCTKVPAEWTKAMFAKIYGGQIKPAPEPKHLETAQEIFWRYLVVRTVIEKTKAKQVHKIPKKYLPT